MKNSNSAAEGCRFSKVAQAAKKVVPGTILGSILATFRRPGGALGRLFPIFGASISASIFSRKKKRTVVKKWPQGVPQKGTRRHEDYCSGARVKRHILRKACLNPRENSVSAR